MNRTELIAAVAERTGSTKANAAKTVDAVFGNVKIDVANCPLHRVAVGQVFDSHNWFFHNY